MTDSECVACAVNSGRLQPPGGPIYVDELWQADHEFTPLLRGYVILKPRRHVHELADLTDSETATLGPLLRQLLRAMRSVLAPERIYVASFAETVHHLHFHLVPRYAEYARPGTGSAARRRPRRFCLRPRYRDSDRGTDSECARPGLTARLRPRRRSVPPRPAVARQGVPARSVAGRCRCRPRRSARTSPRSRRRRRSW